MYLHACLHEQDRVHVCVVCVLCARVGEREKERQAKSTSYLAQGLFPSFIFIYYNIDLQELRTKVWHTSLTQTETGDI